MMCEKCIYRKNCQFLFKHRKAKVESCTAFKSEAELKAEAIREFAERLATIICKKIAKSIDNLNGDDYYITDVHTDIENLVKEMTEKEGGKG